MLIMLNARYPETERVFVIGWYEANLQVEGGHDITANCHYHYPDVAAY